VPVVSAVTTSAKMPSLVQAMSERRSFPRTLLEKGPPERAKDTSPRVAPKPGTPGRNEGSEVARAAKWLRSERKFRVWDGGKGA